MEVKKDKIHWGANLLVMISACVAMYADFIGDKEVYTFLKPLTTILVISLVFWVFNPRLIKFKNLMVIALLFCLAGDILLLKEAYFIFGLGSFLIAHLFFAYGFVALEGFHFGWLSFLVFLGLGIFILFWLRPDLGDMELPVAIYIFVISFMAWQGIGLFLKKRTKAYMLIAIAAVLFMFSDMIIAVNKFKTPFHLSGPVILSTYWMSIALIANATYIKLKEGNPEQVSV